MERVNPELVPRRILSNGMVIRESGWGPLEMISIRQRKFQMRCMGRFKQDIVCLTAQQHMEMKKISATCFQRHFQKVLYRDKILQL